MVYHNLKSVQEEAGAGDANIFPIGESDKRVQSRYSLFRPAYTIGPYFLGNNPIKVIKSIFGANLGKY